MDKANKIVHDVLDYVEANISVGVKTKELDELAVERLNETEETIVPVFKGYKGYPSALCVSINEEIIHGIPNDRTIKDGDIVSIDFGVIYREFMGDAARTIAVGGVSEEVINLIHDTKKALKLGLDQMRLGNCLYDVNKAISSVADKYGNIKKFCGHGIGTNLHEQPAVFNYVNTNEPNFRLQNGLVLALEPMFSLGSDIGIVRDDGWTVETEDKSLSAHWELSVAIVEGKPYILGKDIF